MALVDESNPSRQGRSTPPGDDESADGSSIESRRDLWRYVGVGLEFTLTFGAFLTGGLLIDLHLGTTPGMTVLGAAVGFGAATYRLARQALEAQRDARSGNPEGPHDEI